MNIFGLVAVIGLASFRLTYLWRYDMITEAIRYYVWSWFPPQGEFIPKVRCKRETIEVVHEDRTWYQVTKSSFIGDLTHCHWCVSAYFTAALVVFAKLSGLLMVPWSQTVLLWLASYGVACLALDHARR